MSEESTLCPRCNVNDDGPGKSRTAGKRVFICTTCEQAESMEDFFKGRVTPRSQWPVKVEVKQ